MRQPSCQRSLAAGTELTVCKYVNSTFGERVSRLAPFIFLADGISRSAQRTLALMEVIGGFGS